jgi:hypothetical protein
MKKEQIKFLLLILALLSFFLISYIYRRYVRNDIKINSKFTIGYIYDFTTSLKSGDAWHYRFKYKDSVYTNSRPTHIDYDVKLGDYFLVNFSGKEPMHSTILYDYKLNEGKLSYIDSIWDTIPTSILHSALKK